MKKPHASKPGRSGAPVRGKRPGGLPQRRGNRGPKKGGGLKILYQDKDLIIVHKASGKNTYNDDKKTATGPSVLDDLNKRVGPEKKAYPVHRLDRGTCGVLVFALTPQAASLVQRDFREGRIEKKYWALVLGRTPKKGDWKKRVQDGTGGSSAAHTSFITRGTFFIPSKEADPNAEDGIIAGLTVSWVECEPKTGRYHQIRQHFAGEGFPLLGDYDHGTNESKAAARTLGLKRIALSAVSIDLNHPRLRKPMHVETYPDKEYLAVLEALVGQQL